LIDLSKVIRDFVQESFVWGFCQGVVLHSLLLPTHATYSHYVQNPPVNVFISARIDYCNSLLIWRPKVRLQIWAISFKRRALLDLLRIRFDMHTSPETD